MVKKYTLPEKFQEKIQEALKSIGFSFDQPQKLAKAILRLSDHYQQKSQQTPWDNNELLAASIAYYLPLNYIRNCKVFDEAQKRGFSLDATHHLDFGVGLGPSQWAANEVGYPVAENRFVTDRSPKSIELLQKFFCDNRLNTSWSPHLANKTRAVFSYSLNELSQLPDWFFKLKDIIILEPSTQDKGRKLMELRTQLIEKGYSIWAPCTHHDACPLLTQSKKDWCHDRVHWVQPSWYQKIESHLPIKNQTLTFSYLLASQTPVQRTKDEGRIVGDPLNEKGKTRWLYCRNSEREFLSWLHKSGKTPDWQRGEPITLPTLEKKGNELRFQIPKV